MKGNRARPWRAAGAEDGAATIEFVILFPFFMALFFAAFETGFMMVRNVMLERGVDYAVREMRLGSPTTPTFAEFKQTICDRAVIIRDCDNVVQVEMEPVDRSGWRTLNDATRCIDYASNIEPIDQTNFIVGVGNDLMIVRVCALFEPLFPSTGLGLMTRYNDRGDYALVATAAFVNEPNR